MMPKWLERELEERRLNRLDLLIWPAGIAVARPLSNPWLIT